MELENHLAVTIIAILKEESWVEARGWKLRGEQNVGFISKDLPASYFLITKGKLIILQWRNLADMAITKEAKSTSPALGWRDSTSVDRKHEGNAVSPRRGEPESDRGEVSEKPKRGTVDKNESFLKKQSQCHEVQRPVNCPQIKRTERDRIIECNPCSRATGRRWVRTAE